MTPTCHNDGKAQGLVHSFHSTVSTRRLWGRAVAKHGPGAPRCTTLPGGSTANSAARRGVRGKRPSCPFPNTRLGHSGPRGANRSRAAARGRLAPTDHWGERLAGRGTVRRRPRCAQTQPLLREPMGCRDTGSCGDPLGTETLPLPAARHEPLLADPPEPCRGSGTGDEFRRAARAADRSRTPSTIRTHLAGLGRWAGSGRDPRALTTPTRRRGFWRAGPGPP